MAGEIARSIGTLATLTLPTVSVLLGQGCGGGALAQLPALVGGLRDDDDPAADFAAQKRFTPFTAQYNITGQPAVSLPLHWTDGPVPLPIGVQLVGRPHDEATLVGLAAQLEAASPWADRHPPLFAG